jgi:hypothetical protein
MAAAGKSSFIAEPHNRTHMKACPGVLDIKKGGLRGENGRFFKLIKVKTNGCDGPTPKFNEAELAG